MTAVIILALLSLILPPPFSLIVLFMAVYLYGRRDGREDYKKKARAGRVPHA